MGEEFPYDSSRRPPAPVLSLRLRGPNTEPVVVLTALVDTGADITVIPQNLARRLGLPFVRGIRILGVGGFSRHATVHSAEVEVAGMRDILEVVAFGSEALVGRDLLNRWVVRFDGPSQLLGIEARSPRPGAR